MYSMVWLKQSLDLHPIITSHRILVEEMGFEAMIHRPFCFSTAFQDLSQLAVAVAQVAQRGSAIGTELQRFPNSLQASSVRSLITPSSPPAANVCAASAKEITARFPRAGASWGASSIARKVRLPARGGRSVEPRARQSRPGRPYRNAGCPWWMAKPVTCNL